MNSNQEANFNIPVQVKVSRLAISAISLALSGVILALIFPFIVNIRSLIFLLILYYLDYTLLSIAIVLGIISAIQIYISGGKKTGEKFASYAIILPLFTFVILGILLPALARIRNEKYLRSCGNNLHAIGQAMFVYANDFDDQFPHAGGKGSSWGTSVKWDAETREDAFGIHSDGTAGTATISSSLYLLVKYDLISPKSFICASDRKVSSFEPSSIGVAYSDMGRFWDFGPQPWRHCSYSYHMPYTSTGLTFSSEPGLVVASDRNPWISSTGWKAKSFQTFNPDGTRDERHAGNSPVHSNQGQYVLYLDTHVSFESVSNCGINEDNIYTSWNGSDIRKGTPPKVGSQPASPADSLLVNDPPVKNP